MISIYRSIMFLIVLQECETWSLTLRKERKLGMIWKRVLRKRFGSCEGEGKVSGENCIVRVFNILTHHEILLASN
jgi:hypothetical protein